MGFISAITDDLGLDRLRCWVAYQAHLDTEDRDLYSAPGGVIDYIFQQSAHW